MTRRLAHRRSQQLSTGLFAFLLALVGMAVSLPAETPSAAQLEELPTLPISEIEAGQRGYGLSVFQGSEPVRFDVEVVGVIENMRPGTSFVLARLSGRGLEETGVIAGMSGSPVFIDDRLVGAVAFGWPFSLEAIAGITPISAMRLLSSGDPDATGIAPRGAPIADLQSIARGDLSVDLLAQSLARMQPSLAEGARAGMLWHHSGFSPRVQQMFSESLGSAIGGGAGSGGGPETLQPGSAVAGVLVRGDMNMAATGTVTDRIGDEVFAFGHPFLGLGPTSLPMATAEIVTVLGSQLSSFKISNLGEVVGAFNVDRAAGIRGRIGLRAPTVPLAVTIRGDREASYQLELADVAAVTPGLVAVSIVSALDETTQSGGRAGLDLTARFALADRDNLDLQQSFDGDNAGVQAAIYVLAITGFLEQNGFGTVDLQTIDVELTQYPEPRTLRLVGGHASQSVVRPGDTVRVMLELVDSRGETSRRVVDISLPTGIPAGRYSLLVGDGTSANAARLAIEQTQPVTLDQALDYIRELHSSRDLVALGVFSEPGLSVAGETMPQLPGSLRSIWGAAASSQATPVALAIAQELVEPLDLPIEGMIRIDLEVQRRAPLSATAGAGLGASGTSAGGARPTGSQSGSSTRGKASGRETRGGGAGSEGSQDGKARPEEGRDGEEGKEGSEGRLITDAAAPLGAREAADEEEHDWDARNWDATETDKKTDKEST